jgi:hypothetical protein
VTTKTKALPDAATAHKLVEDAAAKVAALPETERVASLSVGDMVQQGDVYLLRVKDKSQPAKDKTGSRQLAPGNNPGARHVIDPDADVTVYPSGIAGGLEALGVPVASHALLGPLVRALSRFTLMHPEHGHKDMPAGCYQTLFQVDAVTMQRVQD